MWTSDRRFNLVNLAVLAALIAGLAGFNVAVDPFGRYDLLGLDLPRDEVSDLVSYTDHRLAQWTADPAPVILLGDSRMAALEDAAAVWLPDFADLAYGGGTLPEVVATFDYTVATAPITRVVVGVNANQLNPRYAVDRVTPAVQGLRNPPKYFLSPFVTSASVTLLLSAATGGNLASEAPPMDVDAFWRFQLDQSAREAFSDYGEPRLDGLVAMASTCEARGIALTFVVFPTHVDLQGKIDAWGARDRYEAALATIRSLGTVYDYDYDNAITRERDNFLDPFHATEPVLEQVAAEVFGGRTWIARISHP